MYETLLRLYVMAMATGVTSPLPHIVGPPGAGKSKNLELLAENLGVKLHVINLSRISPLDLEGVQMPHGADDDMKLRLLHATFWTQIKEGDIVNFDEMLRAFPEVYNGLLDILTSREVGGFKIPKAFFIGASNSVVAYDSALEDRLLHIPVPDIRRPKSAARKHTCEIFVDALGIMPEMALSMEMQTLLEQEVVPMYEILDQFNGKSAAMGTTKGHSIRNLIGQAQLRQVQSSALKELLDMNNRQAVSKGKSQYVLLTDGKTLPPNYEAVALKLKGNPRLTETQALNLELNLQLIEMERIRNEKGTSEDEDILDALGEEPPF